MFFSEALSFGCIPTAPDCFTCPEDNHDIIDHEISSQAIVDHITGEIKLEPPSAIMANPSNSLVLSDANTNNEAPSLQACNSSSSTFSRQESTTSSTHEDGDIPINDCISKDQDQEPDEVPPFPPLEQSPLVRLISNCSVGSTEAPHCPICLDPMTPIDHQHPLQCPTRHCHFNFCASCINSLLSSSKDDFEIASDGNAHVKIYLHCPNCRADLSTTIRDVLLLRKVDTVLWLQAQRTRCMVELNPSQQRTQQAMQELHVREAIQQAREKEVTFWKTHHQLLREDEEEGEEDDGEHKEDVSLRRSLSRLESSRRLLDGSFVYEEWGVEADLDNGVHSSFRMPPGNQSLVKGSGHETSDKKDSNNKKSVSIDETLLQGLEGLMLHAEQLDVTHWMTSGDPDELAKAAHVLRQIEEDARQGVKPKDRQKVMNRRASVFEIVAETRELMEEKPAKPKSAPAMMGQGYSRRMTPRQRQNLQRQQQAKEHQKDLMALAEKASVLERYPLPVRMPKAVTLECRNDPQDRRFPLRFCNDNWDGTVLDAYTKLSVAPVSRRRLASSPTPQEPWTVSKKPQGQHPGVFNVLSQGQYQRHYGTVQLTTDQPARVLVASVQGAAGRQGVMKGDVITHIDGESLEGKTVNDLETLLRAKREAQGEVNVVLNAEPSVAEALRRRSKAMEN